MKAKGKHKGGAGYGGGLPDTWVNGAAAHYRVRKVRCGKNCPRCPHGPYKYLVWRDGAKVRERYVGKAD